MALADQKITDEELPTIYRLGMAIAAANRRKTPTLTDIETAFIFRSRENLEKIASGEVVLKIQKFDMEGKAAIDPRKIAEYWKKFAGSVLEKWPAPEPEK